MNNNEIINEHLKAKHSQPSDKLMCRLCRKEYTRSNASAHKKTLHHQAVEDFIDQIAGQLKDIDIDDKVDIEITRIGSKFSVKTTRITKIEVYEDDRNRFLELMGCDL